MKSLKVLGQGLLARAHASDFLLRRVGWTTVGYGSTQVIRFTTNIVLTHILAPELFGIMILLTSLRVGIELFTDIGIGQNIVANRNAYDPCFYNTAWTLSILRGLLLALTWAALMPLFSNIYGEEQVDQLLPFFSLFFILTGVASVGLPLAIKGLRNEQTAKFEVLASALGSVLMIGTAALWPNIWGLMVGNLLATFVVTVLSYFVMRGLKYKFMLDRRYVGEIVKFGKWIFLSSILYFLATNFDRLALSKYVSFTLLGIYGLARSLGDVVGLFSGKIGSAIIFPAAAATELRRAELQAKLTPRRIQFLTLTAMAAASFIALAELIIEGLYDERYLPAGPVMPWVGLATWVFILNTLGENTLLGIGKPIYNTIGNAAKPLCLIFFLPVGLLHYGLIGAASATVAAELGRYGCLMTGQRMERISFLRHDLVATALMLMGALLLRTLSYQIGLTASPATLFAFSPP